jgi:hypothetical protein
MRHRVLVSVVPQINTLERLAEDTSLLLGARVLEERAKVKEDAEVAHAAARKLIPALIERSLEDGEGLTLGIWMVLRTPIVRDGYQRDGDLALPGATVRLLVDFAQLGRINRRTGRQR